MGNRTDLAASSLPTGQAYGKRGEQERALKAVPAQPAGPLVAPPSDPFAAALGAAQSMPLNGVGLGGDSERPDEPVTAGLPIGAGPGPQSFGPPKPAGPNPDVLLYAKWMPALELLANSPTASSETRQFYRRLRSQMPVAATPKVGAAEDEVAASMGAQGTPSPAPPSSPSSTAPARAARY